MTEPGIRFTHADIVDCLDILGADHDEDAPTADLAALLLRAIRQGAAHRDEVIRRAEERGFTRGRAKALARASTEEVPLIWE
jgi:hypothetical protein